MIHAWRGLAAALVLGAMTTACQPSLKSTLPVGPAGLANITPPPGPALDSDTLQPGDEININVYQEPDLSSERLVIDRAGNASLPLIGEVHAAGLSPGELAREIEAAYSRRYLRDPRINVVLLESASRVVSVDGEVEKPGVYPIQQGYTLLSAIAMAGSLSDAAKDDEVLLFRQINGQRAGARFDLTEIRAGRMPDPNIVPGDVVVVGYSAAQGAFQDFLKTMPVLNTAVYGAFRVF